jgi:phosphopantothenoylcysteine synthetase/decarboxylase
MNCVVTAGSTYERMDNVRRLTNFSTGSLGCELAAFLAKAGHEVTLLLSEQAVARPESPPTLKTITFGTTVDLHDKMQSLADQPVHAIFHAAAVSDFGFGRILLKGPRSELTEIKSGKISTRQGPLLAELVPTPKIISALRRWFPTTKIVGWKFEVDGDKSSVIRLGQRQIAECLTDACVGNGPAYGEGFVLIRPDGLTDHFEARQKLFAALQAFIQS